MNVLGLITEYNPFHNGHLYHLQKSKKITNATHTVAVMSGNFLQRGEAALLDKWARAKTAIYNGVDLVIELPFAYSCRSAQGFAYGSMVLLEKSKIVSHFCFGSENGNIEHLEQIAQTILDEPAIYQDYLKKELQKGIIFPLARERALNFYLQQKDNENMIKLVDVISSPNNILGIEYIRALKILNSNIIPSTIKRKTAGYNDPIAKDASIASATGIRNKLIEDLEKNIPFNTIINNLNDFLPYETLKVIQTQSDKGQCPILTENLSLPLLWILRSISKEDIEIINDVNEGLEYRIYEAAFKCTNYNDILQFLKTKRYTLTRLKRILLYIMFKYSKELAQEFDNGGGPQYIRVLGFNKKGQEILHFMRNKSQLPIITLAKEANNLSPLGKKMFNLDVQATDLYTLINPTPPVFNGSRDYYEKPIIELNN